MRKLLIILGAIYLTIAFCLSCGLLQKFVKFNSIDNEILTFIFCLSFGTVFIFSGLIKHEKKN